MANLEVELEIETEKASKKVEKDLGKAGKEAGESFGEKFSKSAEKGLEKTVSILEGTVKFATARAATLIAGAFLSAKQEQAVQNLETSLRRIGEFSPQTSKGIQNFASELQSLSTTGDEVILQQVALAQSFGATADQSKRLVAAALDLAAAQGKSVDEATRQLSKTLGGYAGELGETLPILKEFTQEQLRAGEQIDIIAKQFKGFSADSVKTFGGSVKQTTNLLGDLIEADAELITKSPEVIAVIIALGQSFKVLTGVVRDANIRGREFLGEFILGTLNVLRTARVALSDFLKLFFETIDRLGGGFSGLLKALKAIGVAILEDLTSPFREWATSAKGFIGEVITFIETLPFGKVLTDGIRAGVDVAGQAFDGLKEKVGGVFGSVADGAKSAINGIVGEETVDRVSGFITSTGEQIRELATSLFVDGEEESIFGKLFEPFSEENIEKIINNIKRLTAGVTEQTKTLSGKVTIAAADINQALEGALEKGAGSAFQAFGRSLVEGGSFLDSFLQLALSSLGDLAISIGTTVIGAAITISALKESIVGSPFIAIAAGAALIALGGALKAFSSSLGGGGGSAPSSGGGGGGSPDRTDQTFSRFEKEDREDPETRVTLNIQGDILDSDETGLRISRILEEAQLNNNVRVIGGLA